MQRWETMARALEEEGWSVVLDSSLEAQHGFWVVDARKCGRLISSMAASREEALRELQYLISNLSG